MALTDTKIKSLKPSEKIKKVADSGGLYIEVRPAGTKFFRISYRYKLSTRTVQRLYTVGEYPKITLSEARKTLLEVKDLLSRGIDPAKHKKLNNLGISLSQVAKEYMQLRSKTLQKGRIVNFESAFRLHILPSLGDVDVSKITRNDLLEMALQIERKKLKLMPSYCLSLMKMLLDYCVDRGYIDHSVYSPSIRKYLKKYIHKHHSHLSESELPAFFEYIETLKVRQEVLIGLKLLIFLFCRVSELVKAKWSDVDFQHKTLRIPSENMKGAKHLKESGKLERQIALSAQAIQLLEKLKSITASYEFLFPSPFKNGVKPMGLNHFSRLLHSSEYQNKQDAHGFRGLASTILNTYYPEKRYIIEKCLAHKVGSDVERAYNHSQQLSEQREVWQLYADFLVSKGLKI